MRPSNTCNRRCLALAAILAVALGLRCAYLPVDPYPYDQSVDHGELARNIVDHGRWFEFNFHAIGLSNELREREHKPIDPADVNYTAVDAHPDLQRDVAEVIGPGMVLAGIWEITGSERYVYGEIVQILIDTLVVLLVYRIAMLLFKRRRTALIAAALYAGFPPIARQTAILAPDIWGVDFTIAILASYLQALQSSHRLRWLLICGVMVGVGAYFRPNVLVVAPALALAGIYWSGWRQPLAAAATVTALAALLLAPWTIYNYIHFHRLIPVRIGGGQTLWQGLGEIHNDFGAVNDDEVTYQQVHRVRPDLVNLTPPYDEYLRDKALHTIAQHPLFYAKVVARRILVSTVAMYDSAWMYKGGESPVRYRARTGHGALSYAVHRPLELLQSLLEPIVFMFALLGLAFTWKGRGREHALLIAVALAAFALYWIFHMEARYVYPASVAYFIWIALSADMLAERVARQREARRNLYAPTPRMAGHV